MPEVSRFFGIVIALFYDEHNPPHFHARYGEHKASIDIRTLSILEGQLPSRALGLVVEWASQHRNDLLEDWNLAATGRPPHKIPPLN